MPRMISLGSPQSRLQREPADLSLPEIYNSFWRAHGHVLSMDIKLVVGAYQLNTYQITMSGSPQSGTKNMFTLKIQSLRFRYSY
ncbi:hypothetical protein [Diadegma fenestrale ichnovirus]|nr:hypothetical protein [Diadegma fenestrale ichnovirus]